MSLKKIDLKKKVSLKKFTTIRIGGEAKYFFIPHSEDELRKILNLIEDSYYLLGKGSNLLIEDSFIYKPVIKLGEEFNYIKKHKNLIEIGAATPLSSILNYCVRNNLAGLSNLVGIPATLGGLISMNASAFGDEVSSCLQWVDVMDRAGKIIKIEKKAISFGYRFSSLKHFIILRAYFRFPDAVDLKQKLRYFLQKRYASQDFSFPSCGCIFKNHSKGAAAFFIDSCGLKGLAKNDAQISLKHANFIINKHKAKYKDVDYLIGIIKDNVYKKFSIELEEEIERWS